MEMTHAWQLGITTGMYPKCFACGWVGRRRWTLNSLKRAHRKHRRHSHQGTTMNADRMRRGVSDEGNETDA